MRLHCLGILPGNPIQEAFAEMIGTNDPEINLLGEAGEVGLALMVYDLITQNLRRKPEKASDFNALNVRVVIKTPEIDVAVTLDFKAGSLDIYNGDRGCADLTISSDADTVLSLPNLRFTLGIPNYLEKTGRTIFRKLCDGRLNIDGMIANAFQLYRLIRLFSVN